MYGSLVKPCCHGGLVKNKKPKGARLFAWAKAGLRGGSTAESGLSGTSSGAPIHTCCTPGNGQAGGIQQMRHPPLLAGARRCGRHRAHRVPQVLQKGGEISIETFFNQLLIAPLRARLALAVRKTLTVASGNTTEPISRPSVTRPGAWRKARCAPAKACAQCRQRGDFRGGASGLLGADGIAHRLTIRKYLAPSKRRSSPLRQSRQASLVVQGHAGCLGGIGGDPVDGAAVQIMETQRLRHQCRHRALAGGGRAVDGDDGNGRGRRPGSFSTARLSKTSAGMYLGAMSMPFAFGFVEDVGKEAHLELKAENVYAGDVFLAAFQDDFFHKEAGDGQVDRADGHQPPGFLP
jgi:hypothetical protein